MTLKEMTEEAKEARRAYMREWKRKNRDKVKEINARYWANRAAKNAAAADADPTK